MFNKESPMRMNNIPIIRFVIKAYGAIIFPIIPTPAPISTNIRTNPQVNTKLFFNIRALFPVFNSFTERLVRYMRYKGTSGNKHDAKKVTTPAKKATRYVICVSNI